MNEELVVPSTGEIIEIPQNPREVLSQASEAAKALEDMIVQNKKPPVEFNGRRHLEYPHWQVVGKFHKCTAASKEAEFVELDGIKGFKAKGYVIDEKTGQIVGEAEAYCMRDERNWKDKPLFQLASMAQTRAAAKALSNKFRYVAILAGYEPTPWEEMPQHEQRSIVMPKAKASIGTNGGNEEAHPVGGDPDVIEFADAPADEVQKTVEKIQETFGKPKTLSVAQQKLLFAKMNQSKCPEVALKAHIKQKFNKDHSADMTSRELNETLDWLAKLESLPNA